MSKKFKVIFGILFVLIGLFIVLLILPFVIDLNRFKPQIQEAVSKQVNAKIDFSSIQLTILSGLGFKLEDVSVENTDTHFAKINLFQVKEIKFKTDLWPLLSKKIVGSVEIDSPTIKLVKEGGINNVTSLMKIDTGSSNTSLPEGFSQNQVDSALKPQGDTRVKKEEVPIGETKQIQVAPTVKPQSNNDFAKNILIESFIIKNADISYVDLAKKYPILVKNLNLNISNIGLDKEMLILFSTHVDIKDKDYTVKGPVSLKIIATTSLESSKWKKSVFNAEFNLDNLSINFKDIFVKSNSIPFHFSLDGETMPENLVLNNFRLKLQSLESQAKVDIHDFKKLQSIITFGLFSKDVSSLAEILPQHRSLLSKGNFNLSSNIQGDLADVNTIKSLTKLTANLYNSDMSLLLNESAIKPMKGTLRVQSDNLNLGEIIKPFMAPIPQKSNFAIDYASMKFHNLFLDSSIANNLLNVQKFDLNVFKGSMFSNFEVNLAQNPLSYNGKINFKHIQIQDLIKLIQMKEQSPIEGIADVIFSFNGKGTTREVISHTLNVKGNYAFESGKLNIKSILGLASEQLLKYIANINIPGLNIGATKLAAIDLGKNSQKDLKNTKGEFEVQNGKIIVDNNITSDQGDLKLNATVGLDESLGGTALYTANKSVNDLLVAQNKNFSYLFDNKGNLQLNLILGGTLSNPDVKIDPKNLQVNILHNTTKALRDKVTSQIKDQIKNNPEAQKAAESAKKLLKEKGLDLSKFGF